MSGFLALVQTSNPKRTEGFFLGLPDVVDASVWIDGNSMYAHVTLIDDGFWTARQLAHACEDALGKANTPDEIILLGARRTAA